MEKGMKIIYWEQLRIETGGRICACSNKPSGSTKCGEFLE
jgi:hypothetical protein